MSKWQLFDPVENETYIFPINPDRATMGGMEKAVTPLPTSAPNGRTILFEGTKPLRKLSVSGSILEESHYLAMNTWTNKKNQVRLTDDLGRTFWIYITSYQPSRVLSRQHPFRFNYQLDAIVLDWA